MIGKERERKNNVYHVQLRYRHCLKCKIPRLFYNLSHWSRDKMSAIFMNENGIILIKISLKYVPKGPINNIPALVQIVAWHRIGDKPLFEPMSTWFIDTYVPHMGEVSSSNEASPMPWVCIQSPHAAYHDNVMLWSSIISLASWDVTVLLKAWFSNALLRVVAWVPSVKSLSGECHGMKINIGLNSCLVPSDTKQLPEPMLTNLCHHMVTLGLNGLI